MRNVLPVALGVLFWLATQFLALCIAIGLLYEPFWLSLPLVLLYPLAFIRAFGATSEPMMRDRHLLAIAALLDVLVLGSIILREDELAKSWRIPENPLVLISWIALWAGWQMLLIAALVRNKVPPVRDFGENA
jgi:hypothetical protein